VHNKDFALDFSASLLCRQLETATQLNAARLENGWLTVLAALVKTRRSPDGIATRLLRWRQQQEGTQPAIYTGSDKVRLKNCALSKLSFSALPYLCLR